MLQPLQGVDEVLIANWRYHLNYYENYLTKYLLMTAQKKSSDILQSMFQGASDQRTSLPVKRFLAQFFADVIETKPEAWMR